jgi:hypothetical protein
MLEKANTLRSRAGLSFHTNFCPSLPRAFSMFWPFVGTLPRLLQKIQIQTGDYGWSRPLVAECPVLQFREVAQKPFFRNSSLSERFSIVGFDRGRAVEALPRPKLKDRKSLAPASRADRAPFGLSCAFESNAGSRRGWRDSSLQLARR